MNLEIFYKSVDSIENSSFMPIDMIWGDELEIFSIGKTQVAYLYHPGEIVNIKILNRVGSANESKQEWGIAHILEHMFFKGSKKYPDPLDISRAANDIGAKLNAYTTYDHTCYHITTLRENFATAADIISDMFLHPLFSEQEFKKELAPILSELREQEDNPESYLSERALQNFLGSQYHPIIGNETSIQSANSERMFNFFNNYYGSNHCLISIVGDIDLKKVKDSFAVFADFPEAKTTLLTQPKVNNYQTTELKLQKKNIQETYYLFLLPALSYHDNQHYQENLINYLLGGYESSLLFERIREQLGLSCYGVYSWILRSRPYFLQGISCGIAPSQADQLHQEILQQIHLLQNKTLEQEKLKRAKASIKTSIALRVQTCIGLNSMISTAVLRGETENPIRKILETLNNIDVTDVQLGAQKFLITDSGMKAILVPDTV